MTLITHFRNKQISLIAGDSRANNGKYTNFEAKKVFKLLDGLIGYYGYTTNAFYYWLIKTDNESIKYSVEEVCKEFSKTINENKLTGHFSIVISTLERSILLTSYNNSLIELPSYNCNLDNDLKQIVKKNIFFSPTRDEDDPSFCLNHNTRLEKLFQNCYKKIYNNQLFNIDALENDVRLSDLMSLFYREIHRDNSLNRDNIGGPVKFYLIDLLKEDMSELLIDEKF